MYIVYKYTIIVRKKMRMEVKKFYELKKLKFRRSIHDNEQKQALILNQPTSKLRFFFVWWLRNRII